MANGWGGRRERSGPRDAPATEDGVTVTQRLDAEKLRHERIKADRAEFAHQVELGNYLPRDSQRTAAATLLSVITQSLRSIPDNIEMEFSLPPKVIEAIAAQIDAGLSVAAKSLKAMTND